MQLNRIEILRLREKIRSGWWFQKFRSGNENLENEARGRSKSILNKDESKCKVEAESLSRMTRVFGHSGVTVEVEKLEKESAKWSTFRVES